MFEDGAPPESPDVLTAPKRHQQTLCYDVCEPRHVGDRQMKKGGIGSQLEIFYY